MDSIKRVIVVGLDGLEPTIVDALLASGRLPHLARLQSQGGYGRVATTCPAQTPVAWSTFATGTNPGGHGIFDFIRRHPQHYLPDLALNRYEQKNMFLPPRPVNLRGGTPFWQLLSDAGIRSTVLRCPCTYPPDPIRGRMLSGMGVPDVRGGLGTATFYSSAEQVAPCENEQVIRLEFSAHGVAQTSLCGPRDPKTKAHFEIPFTLRRSPDGNRLIVESGGQPARLELEPGSWSEWLKIKFKVGFLQHVRGMVRLMLVRMRPAVELYVSPVNFDPAAPFFPISTPDDYAGRLSTEVGTYYTTGMVEDDGGLKNGRFDEDAFLNQCADVWAERRRMMAYELSRLDQGFFYCLFDTPDRVQHMFWRYTEPDHPAHGGNYDACYHHVIEEAYRTCDDIVGQAMEYVDEQTLFIVLSDHGFTSFRRGVNLNSWLYESGLLALRNGVRPGTDAGELLQEVDWSRTQAYALGLGSIYLNLEGREGQGIVAPRDAHRIATQIAERLTGLRDDEAGVRAVRGVSRSDEVYRGPFASQAPDLIVRFERGYRASWSTALGGIPSRAFEDNTKKWSGDHIVDPDLVPGILFANRPWGFSSARLVDLAPTILQAWGLPPGEAMEGRSLWAAT